MAKALVIGAGPAGCASTHFLTNLGHEVTLIERAPERRALEAIASAGMALDVNTSGLRRPAREIYPSVRMLRRARSLGIDITFGSDAHEPKLVGESFAEAVAQVRAAGYTQFRRYTQRRFELLPLP